MDSATCVGFESKFIMVWNFYCLSHMCFVSPIPVVHLFLCLNGRSEINSTVIVKTKKQNLSHIVLKI